MIKGDRVVSVGKWSDIRRSAHDVVDLGEVVLLPGLVNAHCHLDYTDMVIRRGEKTFKDWARTIIKKKSGWTIADYRKSWMRGARMLEHSGTTTVADIEAVPDLLPWAWRQSSLRVCSFLEMTGVANARRPAKILSETFDLLTRLKKPCKIANVGLSPHALYSTVPELLRLTARRSRKLRVTMHVAESEEEMQMYARREGELFQWLSQIRDMSDCGGRTPVQAVHRAGLLGDNFLAVHCNYLTAEDIRILARTKTHVVHCPSSHVYFGHHRFPYEKLWRAGVNLCVGTDSLASMRGRELNMFAEMQQFSRVYPDVSSETILKMGTINGAKALGMGGKIGELSRGAFADLVAVPFQGDIANSTSCVLQENLPSAVMIGGQWVKSVK